LLAALCGAATLHAFSQSASILERFLAHAVSPPVEYRALRHLEARNEHFGASASMDAWTQFDRERGFQFEIVAEDGSRYIRNRVLRGALEGEARLWAAREPQRAALTTDNYTFEDGIATADGLAAVGLKPRRRDVLLVEGSLFVQPDGELERIEGRLSKAPSFWTRSVEIVRRYQKIAGVRVPVMIESVAHVRIAGRSTFRMTYEYETINGEHVGNPQEPVRTPH